MYLDYFGLKEIPFSIAPDPRYLYMSERHREALAHLLYGVSGQGGFVVLTGEVGTGKTTICRCFLNQIPKNTDVAFIINPKLSARELMATICDELSIEYSESSSIKVLNDLINHYLLSAHADNRHTVLIIDEAQNLRVDVLEQLRLLTNLETSEKKLLQIILLGQPELRELLAQTQLRQLAQRVTARYHLHELSKMEVGAYVQCRLAVAGRKGRIFTQQSIKRLYQLSGGVPRLINLICDRALLGAYASQSETVEVHHIKHAYDEIQGERIRPPLMKNKAFRISLMTLGAFCVFILAIISFNVINQQFENKSNLNALSSAEPKQLNAGQLEAGLSDTSKPVSEEIANQPIIEVQAPISQVIPSISDSEDDFSQTSVAELSPVQKPVQSQEPEQKRGAPFLEQITGLVPTADDKFYAFQALLNRWGVDYQKKPFILACKFAEMYGLRCFHNSGNWRSVLKLDRPTVLTLTNELGQSLHFALLAIEGQDALISYQGEMYWVGMDELDRYWLGEYSVLWKLPPYKSSVITPGQASEGEWLQSNLSRLSRSYLSINEPMNKKIQRFQQSSGLVPDGIPGTMTLIHINKRLCSDCPKLLGGM
ncbi:MAG: general secretion pathway protein A [Oleiphilaceae bacterium]|jgi:general secretion pathway protein A